LKAKGTVVEGKEEGGRRRGQTGSFFCRITLHSSIYPEHLLLEMEVSPEMTSSNIYEVEGKERGAGRG